GAGRDAAFAAVVADSIHRSVMDNGRVVDIMNIGDVHIGDRAVVEKMSVVPTPTFESYPEISEAVGDTAIEADMRTPVSVIEDKPTIAPSPVARSPEKAVAGAKGLLVNGQSGRTERDRYTNLRK